MAISRAEEIRVAQGERSPRVMLSTIAVVGLVMLVAVVVVAMAAMKMM